MILATSPYPFGDAGANNIAPAIPAIGSGGADRLKKEMANDKTPASTRATPAFARDGHGGGTSNGLTGRL